MVGSDLLSYSACLIQGLTVGILQPCLLHVSLLLHTGRSVTR